MFDRGIEKAAADDDFVIQSDGEGGFTLVKGSGEAARTALQRSTRGRIEKQLDDSQQDLGRLIEIGRSFDPRAFQHGARFADRLTSQATAFGIEVDPTQLSEASGRIALRAEVTDRYNQLLARLSGAAVTESEARRYQGAQINANDTPLDAATKFATGVRLAAQSTARNRFALENDLDADGVALGDVVETMRSRARQLAQEFEAEAPEASAEEAAEFVEQGLIRGVRRRAAPRDA